MDFIDTDFFLFGHNSFFKICVICATP